MALPHATHLDVINVRPLGPHLQGTVSTSLIKTERIQLLHLVLAAQQEQPEHHVDDECTIHCLEGDVDIVMPVGSKRLQQGDVMVLPAQQKHAVRARTDCSLLVTLMLHRGDAGDDGGTGARTLAAAR